MPVDVAAVFEIRAKVARDRDGVEAVVAGSDPAVDRHDADLFGDAGAPDHRPPEARYVAPRMVLVEWLGQPSPFESDVVLALKARGMLTGPHRLILEQAALQRVARVDGRTSRTLSARDGLTQTYRWGPRPGTYIQEMSMVDAERLFSTLAGPEFRLVGRHDTEERRDPDEAWKKALAFLRGVSSATGLPAPPTDDEAAHVRIAYSEPERLIGLAGRTGNAIGVWERPR